MNPIQIENAKPGTPDWRLNSPAQQHEIEGYASASSLNRGETLRLFVNTTNSTYSLEVFRWGWYGGDSARRVLGPVTLPGYQQVIPTLDPITGLAECQWTNPYVLPIPDNPLDPTDWASGYYLARLTGGQDGKQSYIIWVVRDDDRASAVLSQASFTTYQAYNHWGGKSLYDDFSTDHVHATKVSFNRPYGAVTSHPTATGAGDFFAFQAGPGWECNWVRWVERQGYDVTYCDDVATHAITNLLWNHRLFVSVGHDEYWSWRMFDNVQAARDRGVNLAFLGANISYWQIRLEPGVVDGTPDRTEVCYKTTADPYYYSSSNRLTTVHFRDYPVLRWESALLGVKYDVNTVHADFVVQNPDHWVCNNTGTTNGSVLAGLVGYEVDSTNLFSPSGVALIGSSPYVWLTSSNELATYFTHAAAYTHSNGATVFASGSMQWNWGLDDVTASAGRPSWLNPTCQQMTRNVLARSTDQPLPSWNFFFNADARTLGNWKPAYGIEGQALPGEVTNLPPYVAMVVNDAAAAVFATNSSDARALQRVAGSGRVVSGWTSPTNLTVDFLLTDGLPHQVALYFWDWDNSGRSQTVQLLDAATGDLLDERGLTTFAQPRYLVWQCSGPVRLRVTSDNAKPALLNGVFLGSGGQARFVSEDALTRGDWKGVYGTDGQLIPNDSTRQPAYGSVGMWDPAPITWSNNPAADSALQRASGGSRIASGWQTKLDMTVQLDFNDAQEHQLALYFLDWEAKQRAVDVRILDAATHAVLDSRSLSNFTTGKWLVWNVRGRTMVRIHRSWGADTALAGIFLGPANQPPIVTLTQPEESSTITLPATVCLRAEAADPDGAIAWVEFYDGGNLLATRTNSPFEFCWSNHLWVGWHTLTARACDNRRACVFSAPVQCYVVPPPDYEAPVVELVNPLSGAELHNPTNVLLAASVVATAAPPVQMEFIVDGVVIGVVTGAPPYLWDAGILETGPHTARARVTDAFGVQVTSPGVNFMVFEPEPGARFVATDNAVQGNWVGLYGTEGYCVVNAATNLPHQLAVTSSGHHAFTWVGTTSDPRALLRPNRRDRIAATWFTNGTFRVDLNFLDGRQHRTAFYLLDWNALAGAETVKIKNPLDGTVLDTRSVSNFASGQYLVWDLQGHVQAEFSRAAGSQARLSGFFFDGSEDVPRVRLVNPADAATVMLPTNVLLTALAVPGNATVSQVEFFAGSNLLATLPGDLTYNFTWSNPPAGTHTLTARVTDTRGVSSVSPPITLLVEAVSPGAVFGSTTTNVQGNWIGVYGAEGYSLAADAQSLPASLQFSVNSPTYVWAYGSATRYLQRPAAIPSRIAAAWYSSTNVTLDFRFLDTGTHRVALYFMDYTPYPQAMTVKAANALTGQVLDTRTFSSFSSGVYLDWLVSGHVKFIVTRATGANAIVSGVFVDRLDADPVVSLTQPADGNSYSVPVSVPMAALVLPGSAPISRVEYYAGPTLVGVGTVSPNYAFTWSNAPAGTHVLSARVVDNAGRVGVSSTRTITIESIAAAARFLKTNLESRGDWPGLFGSTGVALASDATNLPAFVQASFQGVELIWNSFTTDPRALVRTAGPGRVAAAWRSYTNLVLDLKFTDTNQHRVTLYCLDWYGTGGAEILRVVDYVRKQQLDARTLGSFSNGVYLTWDLQGHIQFQISRAGGSPAVVSGVFWDPSLPVPTITLTSPTPSERVTLPTSVPLAATLDGAAYDLDRVEFVVDGSTVARLTNGPPFTAQWGDAPQGMHWVQALALGRTGPDSASPPVQFFVLESLSQAVITSCTRQASGLVQLDAFGVSGVSYQLQRAAGLLPPTTWSNLTSAVAGTNGVLHFTDPGGTNRTGLFYRLKTL